MFNCSLIIYKFSYKDDNIYIYFFFNRFVVNFKLGLAFTLIPSLSRPDAECF